MKSNYRRVGDYIQEVNIRNTELNVSELLGINIDKYFMPSVANTIGTDMTTYKIVKKRQFACNRMHVGRDERLPVAFLKQAESILVSPAYSVFEVKDENVLSPEYLMMWFSRKEFDRNAWFYTDADVRGGLNWADFCNIEIPVPSIEKQKEIIKEYNILIERMNLNNRFIKILEETAQMLYKQWFIDFEFPNQNGNPYKSSGGEMEFSEKFKMEIPKMWKVGKLSDIANIIMGQSPPGESLNMDENGMVFYQGRTDFGFRFPDIRTYTTSPKRKCKKGDILLSVRAPVGDLNIAVVDCSIGRGIAALKSKFKCTSHLFYLLRILKSEFSISNLEGTVFGSINKDDLHELKIIYSEDIMKDFEKLISVIDRNIKEYSFQNKELNSLKELLFAKMTIVRG